jgi:hypothetical protein
MNWKKWLTMWKRESDPVSTLASLLVQEAQELPGAGGAYKAHWVLAKLKKAHPERRTRDLRMIIEQVVQTLPD